MRDYHVYSINSPTGKMKDEGVALGIEDGVYYLVFSCQGQARSF
jgi:hypothetical protein